jgi:hypothetical protein
MIIFNLHSSRVNLAVGSEGNTPDFEKLKLLFTFVA